MPSLPSASIVLCTFNGERFLAEQLASLRAQTAQPREVIVQDDLSTDNTISILETELRKSNALPLQIKRNTTRLGFAQNFAAAIGRARGEIIFLCDQDDVWEPQKVELLLQCFARDPSLALVFSEGSYIDSAGQKLPGQVLAGNGLTPAKANAWQAGNAFPDLLRNNPVPGMLLAFRAAMLPNLLPIPSGWEHDYFTLLLASGLGLKIAVESAELVRYRRHQSQAVGTTGGIEARWNRASGQALSARVAESRRWESLCERLAQGRAPKEFLDLAAGKRDHLARRGNFSSFRIKRFLEIAAEGKNYGKFEAGWTSALKDLLAR